jgi:hypothetical protein
LLYPIAFRSAESEAPIADKEVDIDAEVDAFMKRQAEKESGGTCAVLSLR